MKLSDFDYCLPKEFIAQFPLKKRDQSRLLVVNRFTGEIFHHKFSDLTQFLNPGDCLILNNTKVLPARLFAKRITGGKVEILLLEKKSINTFRCLLKPGRLKINEIISFDNNLKVRLLSKDSSGYLIRFITAGDISSKIKALGVMPLPPYISRPGQDSDFSAYQTVYAKHDGAVAAPTAGLHFTKLLLGRIKAQGIKIGFLTLHVGWGTFRPIKAEDIKSHEMESEEFDLPKETADLVNQTRKDAGRVFCIGTTTARALEAVCDDRGMIHSRKGKTGLFIYPGYKFKVVDCLLTNFHLSKSTLFLLVSAFAGRDLIFKAYKEAIKERYRFYSYGDAMLIL
ncbi:MAG: tRNA preQ1(34) S-adenosylmethionine ribosyltransferase-isomerase QueA [Candidatus Omnitrophota bacterium]